MRTLPLLLFVASFSTSGCAYLVMREQVEHRARYDLGCEDGAMNVVDKGGGAFAVQGCGKEADFVCVPGGYSGATCVREGPAEVRVGSAPAPAAPVKGAAVESKPAGERSSFPRSTAAAAFAAASQSAQACGGSEGDPVDASARIVVDPSGRVSFVGLEPPELERTAVGKCAMETLQRVRIPSFDGAAVTVRKRLTLRTPGGAEAARASVSL